MLDLGILEKEDPRAFIKYNFRLDSKVYKELQRENLCGPARSALERTGLQRMKEMDQTRLLKNLALF